MSYVSKPLRLLLTSPWVLLFFLVIPVAVILSLAFHRQLPSVAPSLLLANNICCSLLVAVRLLRYLAFMGRKIRYGACSGHSRRGGMELTRTPGEIRSLLPASGYYVTPDGLYGEKHDAGYAGTIILYGGLLLLLAVGSWDNLYNFSGVLLDGMGPATDLNSLESYRSIGRGPLAAKPGSLPRMVINKQYLPDSTYPRGATDVSLLSGDGSVQQHRLVPREPVRCGEYDLFMAKLVFQPELVIKSRDSKVLFDSLVTLDPLVQKRGDFGFYGPYVGNDLVGGVYYQPEKSLLMVVITRNGQRIVTDLKFQVDQQVEQGEYILSCAKMGQWSEIHLIRRRHKKLLMFGGFLALAALILRLAVRPERLWLEESPGGCRAWCSGKKSRLFIQEMK